MVYLTPTRRLEWLLTQNAAVQAHDAIAQLILHYESFLKSTDAAEDDLVKIFLDREKSREYRRQANKFGDLMFEVLSLIGSGTQFHRLLVV